MESSLKPPAEAPFHYIDSEEKLSRLVEALKPVSRVGLDTEADSLHHYFDKVCLIQISFSGEQYIIDTLCGLALTEFFETLADKELILQGADYDLRMLKKTFSFRPQNRIFDTMLAAQVLGYEKIGLAALVEKFCNVQLSKTGQKSDWSRRPLSPSLLAYASNDTRFLETLADQMTAHLRELGREAWHQECCERAVAVSGQSDKNETRDPWRLKGTSKMEPGTLVFVRELWKWRDEEAQHRDRPPFMILQKESIVTLAEWLALHPKASLAQGPAWATRISGGRRERLEAAILKARSLPPAEWPERPKRQPWPEEDRFDMAPLDPLLEACRALAAKLKMDAGVLASRSALTSVVQRRPASVQAVMEECGFMRWQAELLMPLIAETLKV